MSFENIIQDTPEDWEYIKPDNITIDNSYNDDFFFWNCLNFHHFWKNKNTGDYLVIYNLGKLFYVEFIPDTVINKTIKHYLNKRPPVVSKPHKEYLEDGGLIVNRKNNLNYAYEDAIRHMRNGLLNR